MHRLLRDAALSACVLLCSVAPARAGTDGSLTILITRDGHADEGVTVTLDAPDGVVRSAVSGRRGDVRFVRLPFGRYVLHAGAERRDVEIATGSADLVTVDVAPSAIARTTTVGRRGPGADPVAVTTLGRAEIDALPQNQSLDRLVETLPGIARFSYDEPVAHGFHGVTYELDGVPLPQGTTSNFGEILDPRTIDSLEVFTGAFPAEFGGSRQGAVVELTSRRPPVGAQAGRFTVGGGSYGGAQTSLSDAFRSGAASIVVDANLERTDRGIDTPTVDPRHDGASRANAFVRVTTPLSSTDSLAVDLAADADTLQIPTSTSPSAVDPVVDAPGTDDVQIEQNRFASVAFTHDARDRSGYLRVVPWVRADRVAYLGDLATDVLGTATDPASGASVPLDGLREDRRSVFTGLRVDGLRAIGRHTLKAGLDLSAESFLGSTTIAQTGSPAFVDRQARHGSAIGLYLQDHWTPTPSFSLAAGLRADRSTGYVSGGQLSPRIEADLALGPADILHAYYGTLYAAPFLEDTRREAVVTAGGGTDETLPVYDLQPEHDAYVEFGLAHTIAPRARATVDVWKRDVRDVLDTTQIFPTPVFAVFNNTIGVAKGVDVRIDARSREGDALTVSATLSSSRAGGVSGGTFLFDPGTTSDVTLQPEDHDQTFAATIAYTKRFGDARRFFATLSPQYGTGYPVAFQDGPARLAPHLTADVALGRDPGGRLPGFTLTAENLTNRQYLVKVDNGFNTTQYAAGARITLRVTQAF